MGDHLQTEAVVPISCILSKSFFRHYHSFSLLLKHKKSVQFQNECRSSSGQRLSFLAYNLLWPCSLIETPDRVKWDSLIVWSLVSLIEVKTSREDGDNNQSRYMWSDECLITYSKYHIPLLHSTTMNYLAGKKSGKYREEIPYGPSFYSRTAVSYPSLFSWTCLVNTVLLIPNEFRTVFELGIQRSETLEQLEIQYLQAPTKPERETFKKSIATRIAYPVFACLLPLLYPYSTLYRNINSTTILVHRTTVHM